MIIRKILFLWIFLVYAFPSLCTTHLAEQFKQTGYIEMCDKEHGTTTFDSLYACFDELIEFLQAHPVWAQKLYSAKERFIRSKDKNYYATDFFGLYDESKNKKRGQISFYYSIYFHDFISSCYPQLNDVPEINRFLNMCREIQEPYGNLFEQAAIQLGVKEIFSSGIPILFKVMKYLPSHIASKPHYDGTAFSLFLDSTDHQSLLLSPYKPSFAVTDFSCPVRRFSRLHDQNSILLIPGILVRDFDIYPTPHIVTHSGKTRYATIAFAMRPHYVQGKNEFTALPNFNH